LLIVDRDRKYLDRHKYLAIETVAVIAFHVFHLY